MATADAADVPFICEVVDVQAHADLVGELVADHGIQRPVAWRGAGSRGGVVARTRAHVLGTEAELRFLHEGVGGPEIEGLGRCV